MGGLVSNSNVPPPVSIYAINLEVQLVTRFSQVTMCRSEAHRVRLGGVSL